MSSKMNWISAQHITGVSIVIFQIKAISFSVKKTSNFAAKCLSNFIDKLELFLIENYICSYLNETFMVFEEYKVKGYMFDN